MSLANDIRTQDRPGEHAKNVVFVPGFSSPPGQLSASPSGMVARLRSVNS